MHWDILTGSYPPVEGGVSDYTAQVAEGLIPKGHTVTVFAPADEAQYGVMYRNGVKIVWLPDHYGWKSIRLLAKLLMHSSQGSVFVQYVPHAFGWKGLNLLFIYWLFRNRSHYRIWTMFHEVSYHVERKALFRHHVLAQVTRLMASCMARASTKIFITIPGWELILRKVTTFDAPIMWLPVTSNVPPRPCPKAVAKVRAQLCSADQPLIIGHFGTFGLHITNLLTQILPTLMSNSLRFVFLLTGRGSVEFGERIMREFPVCAGRVQSTGGLSLQALAEHLGGCDLLIQPYPDGVSSRRTTTMAGLSLGIPVITNRGFLTESIWADTNAVAIADAFEANAFLDIILQLLHDATSRKQLGQRGLEVYKTLFSLDRLLDQLVRNI